MYAHRLYNSLRMATPAQEDQQDADWQKAFKLSYSVGSSVLQKVELLPGSMEHSIGGSHLLRLCMKHHQMTAPPAPVAGQGTPHPSGCFACNSAHITTRLLCTCLVIAGHSVIVTCMQ